MPTHLHGQDTSANQARSTRDEVGELAAQATDDASYTTRVGANMVGPEDAYHLVNGVTQSPTNRLALEHIIETSHTVPGIEGYDGLETDVALTDEQRKWLLIGAATQAVAVTSLERSLARQAR